MILGGVDVQTTRSRTELFSCILWGKPACGKTVLAATAPGRKLWLQFDPAGTASLVRSDDILVADFSSTKPARLEDFKQGGSIESALLKLLDSESIDTVVVDSVTAFGQLALVYGIVTGKASSGKFRATIETPGTTGYGVRLALILDFIQMVQRVCTDKQKHVIFICHEAVTRDKAGDVKEITIALGGQAQSLVPARVSEVWHMEDTGRQRLLYVRSHGLKAPMRTRMFTVPPDKTSFVVHWNQDTANGTGIVDWYDAWKAAGFSRIPLPSK